MSAEKTTAAKHRDARYITTDMLWEKTVVRRRKRYKDLWMEEDWSKLERQKRRM